MNYVESFNLFGVEAKQVPCITGSGAPTLRTGGVIGCLYMDITSGDIYKCVGVSDDIYTWEMDTHIDDNNIGQNTWSSQKIYNEIMKAVEQAGIIQATVE